jgi:dTDP-4-amino-4,6-dideoxygalactose transaminase
MNKPFISLNRPSIVGRELEYIEQALRGSHRHGSGSFTGRCQAWLEQWLGGGRAFLTQSCTVGASIPKNGART